MTEASFIIKALWKVIAKSDKSIQVKLQMHAEGVKYATRRLGRIYWRKAQALVILAEKTDNLTLVICALHTLREAQKWLRPNEVIPPFEL